MHQRSATPRPRVQGRRSRAGRSNERWATNLTHVHCGADGGRIWRTATIARSWAMSSPAEAGPRRLNGRLRRPAWRASARWVRPTGVTPVIRSDNGLVYQSRRLRAACRDYRLQEFITPYTPEQNGIIERLKEECVWQHLFPSFAAARREIMPLPSALSPPTSRDSITAGGGPWQRTIPSLASAGRRSTGPR